MWQGLIGPVSFLSVMTTLAATEGHSEERNIIKQGCIDMHPELGGEQYVRLEGSFYQHSSNAGWVYVLCNSNNYCYICSTWTKQQNKSSGSIAWSHSSCSSYVARKNLTSINILSSAILWYKLFRMTLAQINVDVSILAVSDRVKTEALKYRIDVLWSPEIWTSWLICWPRMFHVNYKFVTHHGNNWSGVSLRILTWKKKTKKT